MALLLNKTVVALFTGDELLLMLQRQFECVSYCQLLGLNVVKTRTV